MGVEARDDHLAFGEPTLLFEGPPTFDWRISPFPDGQRFLLTKPAEEEIPQPLNLIVNWTAALER